MGEHVPVTDKLILEKESLAKNWRKNKALIIVVGSIALAFAAGHFYEIPRLLKENADLQKANEKLGSESSEKTRRIQQLEKHNDELRARINSFEARSNSGGNVTSTGSGPAINQSAQTIVESFNQTGGVIAETVIVKNGVEYKLSATSSNVVAGKPINGKFASRILLHLESPIPVGNLYIEAHGTNMESMDVSSTSVAGPSELGNTGKRPGFHFTNIPGAFGDYYVDVVSKTDEKITVECKFN